MFTSNGQAGESCQKQSNMVLCDWESFHNFCGNSAGMQEYTSPVLTVRPSQVYWGLGAGSTMSTPHTAACIPPPFQLLDLMTSSLPCFILCPVQCERTGRDEIIQVQAPAAPIQKSMGSGHTEISWLTCPPHCHAVPLLRVLPSKCKGQTPAHLFLV